MLKVRLKSGRLFAALVLTAFLAVQPVVPANADINITPEITIQHKGITLAGVPAHAIIKSDVKYLSLKEGLKKIAQAINVIYTRSHFSASKIETLKKNGEVNLIYYPSYQEGKVSSFALASFFPDFFKRNGKNGKKGKFVVMIGPHAVKWPAEELAMIIVHELVGHGIQHLQGRLDYIRVLDLECAANLYGEKFYQDLRINKKSDDVIKFRKEFEIHWCSDFKRYMSENDPQSMAMWDVLNPDIPRLLDIFDGYANDLRQSGISGKAIKAAKKMQRDSIEKQAR